MINPHDFVLLVKIMSKLNTKRFEVLEYMKKLSHISKSFLYSPFLIWLLFGIELAKEFKKIAPQPSTAKEGIEEFDDGEALKIRKGIVCLENHITKRRRNTFSKMI